MVEEQLHMFETINKELERLQQDIYRCRNIDTMLSSLKVQLSEQERKRERLELELKKENLDVEKLSKMSIASVFYTILGSKERQMEKERQEAFYLYIVIKQFNAF